MHLASSTKHALLALGIGVSFAACGDNTPAPPATYTWTQVSTDIKNSCATVTACHLKGTTQPFSYDKALTPGSDMANYTLLMTANLIDKTTPANSVLIVVGSGGNYMGAKHSGSNLSTTQATNWTNWITAGASFQ
jgi:hypothetical protein